MPDIEAIVRKINKDLVLIINLKLNEAILYSRIENREQRMLVSQKES